MTIDTSKASRRRVWLFRLLLVAVAAAISLVWLPRMFGPAGETPPASLHGALAGGHIAYRDATVSDVLEDIGRLTGFQAVTFPEIRARRFTGELALDKGGEEAVRMLAARLGLSLRHAGPHWALVAAPAQKAP